MLAEFFDSPSRIRRLRDGPEGRLLEGFACELCQAGYAVITARRHIRAAEHLIYWARQEGQPVTALHARSVEDFARHLDRCRCGRYGHTAKQDLLRGVHLFLDHSGARARSASVTPPPIQNPVLFTSFCQWMRHQRGTCDATLYNYSIHIRELLRRLGEDSRQFEARSLRAFVLERSRTCGWAAAKQCTTALRMFVRFLIAQGHCAVGLEAAIPTLAHWRLAALPRYLQPEEVERLIASCDRASPVGRRDRAILLLLARLGLRAGDIVHLRLSDIDWKGAWLHVCGKGRCPTRLPLTQEVGQAIVSYLQNGRPGTKADTLFVRCRAPFRAFGNHCAVSVIVDRALRRAGVARPSRGAAHLLRHSVATSMLRQGATLQDIAVILRHRSIETTQIYAKVDVVALQQIAQPWPEVHPC